MHVHPHTTTHKHTHTYTPPCTLTHTHTGTRDRQVFVMFSIQDPSSSLDSPLLSIPLHSDAKLAPTLAVCEVWVSHTGSMSSARLHRLFLEEVRAAGLQREKHSLSFPDIPVHGLKSVEQCYKVTLWVYVCMCVCVCVCLHVCVCACVRVCVCVCVYTWDLCSICRCYTQLLHSHRIEPRTHSRIYYAHALTLYLCIYKHTTLTQRTHTHIYGTHGSTYTYIHIHAPGNPCIHQHTHTYARRPSPIVCSHTRERRKVLQWFSYRVGPPMHSGRDRCGGHWTTIQWYT